MPEYTLVDTFAGAGGLSLGFRDADFRLGASFDFDRAAVLTYRANLGDHALEAAASDVTGIQLMAMANVQNGDGVVVAGGPPCQGFSRQRRGSTTDIRNDLIFEFLRLANEIGPEIFVMENVAAITGPRGREYLKVFREIAENAGYVISVGVLNAADFGVAQSRRRAFIIGERGDKPASFRFPAPVRAAADWKTVRDAIGDLPSPIEDSDQTAEDPNHRLGNISPMNQLRISFVPEGGGRADVPEHLRLQCHFVSVDKAGHRGVYGRLAWDKPAGTITTKCNSFTRGRFGHPSENRNITMREAARLQSFPDWFRFSRATVDAAHQIGNAVPPELARHLGLAIRDAMDRRAAADLVPKQLAMALA